VEKEERLKLEFWISLFRLPDGRVTIQIRKIILDRELAKWIVQEVLKRGELKVDGVIKIKDPVSALTKLRMVKFFD